MLKLQIISFLLIFIFFQSTKSQVCNNADKFSGGIVFPALSTGGTKPTYKNGSTYPASYCDFTKDGLPIDPECCPPDFDVQPLAAIIYFLLLLYFFMGVGLYADVFMSAIEVITSRKKIVEYKDAAGEDVQTEIYLWNATVANLTLMALGSSAPEILLSLIEIMGANYFSGELGPATIVGSAAFNLMVIIAVCVSCIPPKTSDGKETGFRKIEQMGVFYVTAFFSLFAYIWLLIILLWITPNFVTIGEALLTLLFFPLLVIICWTIDSGKCKRTEDAGLESFNISGICDLEPIRGKNPVDIVQYGTTKKVTRLNEVDQLLKGCANIKVGDPELHAKLLADVAMAKNFEQQRVTRATYRVNATRALTGGKSVIPEMPDLSAYQLSSECEATFYFAASKYSVLESSGGVLIDVMCKPKGNEEKLSGTFSVEYKTGDVGDTATAGADYAIKSGTLTFVGGTLLQQIDIPILEDDEEEEDEIFTVKLFNPSEGATIRKTGEKCKITIIDDERPGVVGFAFHKEPDQNISVCYRIPEDIGCVAVKVIRQKGSTGEVSVKYKTEDGHGSRAAFAGEDYKSTKGTLIFKSGEVEKFILVPIINSVGFEKDEHFYVKIYDPNVCTLGKYTNAKVIIVSDDEMKQIGTKVLNLMEINVDRYRLGGSNWRGQFLEALEGPEKGANTISKIMHGLNVPWKLTAAMIPPTTFVGGWLCFFVSLGFVGATTAFIGDIASHFGCCVGLLNSVTAITIVALGTSLPDTFASKSAAIGDSNADNSVGNVTGSNSVNVFLGLGLPWTMAAIYWHFNGPTEIWKMKVGPEVAKNFPEGGFYVASGSLGFSVIVFSICALVTLGILIRRGQMFDGELGGQYTKPTSLLFVLLWFVYVFLSILKAYEVI